jgi:hypothetical protein
LLALTFILFPIVLVALLFLPDMVPLHFTIELGAETTVDSWGSKYLLLLGPLILCISGTFMIGLTWFLNKRGRAEGKGGRGGMIMFYLSIAIKVFLIALILWVVYTCYVYTH